jgi:hypothetical protein
LRDMAIMGLLLSIRSVVTLRLSIGSVVLRLASMRPLL